MGRMPDKVKQHFEALNAKANAKKAALRQCDAEALAYVRPIALVWLDAHQTLVTVDDEPARDALAEAHGSLADLLQFGPLLVRHLYPRARGQHHYVIRTESSGRGYHQNRDVDGSFIGWRRGPKYNDPKYVHCRYCGVKLHQAHIGGKYDDHPNVQPHVTQCALESLAGLRTPVAPGQTMTTEDSEGQTP